jgi:hypothetical protein
MLKAAQSGFYDHLWKQKGGVGSCDIWYFLHNLGQ